MLKTLQALDGEKEKVKELIVAAGDDQQKKMMTVVPKLQEILKPVLEEFGFPAPPMGAHSTAVAHPLRLSHATPTMRSPSGACLLHPLLALEVAQPPHTRYHLPGT